MASGELIRISGSVVSATGLADPGIFNRVEVGPSRLAGEIIRVRDGVATIQVYESTEGLQVGDPVKDTGGPFSVTLGPGLLGSVFDGMQRPLDKLRETEGVFISRGSVVDTPLGDREWEVSVEVVVGQRVEPGMVVAKTREQDLILHLIMCPPGVSGVVTKTFSGPLAGDDPVCALEDGTKITLYQQHPCRIPRPHGGKLSPELPAVTGQRVIDCFFPLAHGGLAIVPGGFGTGKTVLEHTIAKFLDVDVVVYVGCGERGNEMTDILKEFNELVDPSTGRPMMERTVLIANTSNMPVAAREASVYTGITIAEYYRDMGLKVAMLADSVSRWGEALREISSRLEEMPGEEGFPPYLASRLSKFYERTGRVRCLGENREGALSLIAAVSPPGGDLSEPITQASLRMAGCYWALDQTLAAQRHFPAVDWTQSFSLYKASTEGEWTRIGGEGWSELIENITQLLSREESIREIAHLVGFDALQEHEKTILQTGQALREGFLRQDSFSPVDGFCPPAKTRAMMERFVATHRKATEFGGNEAVDGAGVREPVKPDYRSLYELRLLSLEELEGAEEGGGDACTASS